ncbi:MAG: hypothetical protein ACOX3L_11390 [Lutisporaceae bacterium]
MYKLNIDYYISLLSILQLYLRLMMKKAPDKALYLTEKPFAPLLRLIFNSPPRY